MRRFQILLGLFMGLAPLGAGAQMTQQALVDRATLTVQELMTEPDPVGEREITRLLGRARAVMICPRIFRAGFIFGGQGGACVLTARDGAGSWSSPAFYALGSGSVGFQIGLQDMQMMMLIMTNRGLTAIMDSQFKVGADASIAVATVGASVAGATTAAVGADIVAFARTRGLYAGVALDGTIMSSQSEDNAAYYGRPLAARQIVVDMSAHNPAADPLRAALMRYGAGAPSAPAMAAGPPPGPGYAPGPGPQAGPPMQTAPTGTVRRETLR
ncbi:lipid-binding SYLF domain-containing protein [Muricoccus radiodurans]|uniref:lipid-binding SYLF domain-containing protein n=1 Tax=Muricoccus radiodurans TaxID=2231721 RepID=UPI003CE7493D